jgi:glycosyltransferase involved in cell wall biosynthesis
VVHGWSAHLPDRYGRVMVERHRASKDYWGVYPSYADVLVMPRRYAGLSLPVQEAASLGMGLVMLDVPPYNEMLAPESLVATRGPGIEVPMVGGTFTVHSGDVTALAAKMDELVRDPALCERLSKHSDLLAESLSWDVWAPRYLDLLAEVALSA